MLELPVNKDHYGLGYHSHQLTQRKATPNIAKGQIFLLPDIFTSVWHLIDGQISVVEDKDGITDEVFFVYQKDESQ